MFDELYAKSSPAKSKTRPPTITAHCREVRDAALAIWDSIEPDLAQSLGVDRVELRRVLLPIVLCSALLHDIGKANSSFQELVHAIASVLKRQPVRHEVISAILIAESRYLGSWLCKVFSRAELWALAWSVAGHHLQVRQRRDEDAEDPLYRTANIPRSVTFYLGDRQIGEMLTEIRTALKSFGLEVDQPKKMPDESFSTLEDDQGSLESIVRTFVRDSRKAWKELKSDSGFGERLALLKAMLISADVAGSALPADGKPTRDWIPRALSERVAPSDLDAVISGGLKGKPFRRFQLKVASSNKPATVVMAGCGNGKTTGAYMWGHRWAQGKKLFFTYPTTGTASAGFEDYLLAQDHIARTLIHGRSWVDLQAMQTSPEDDGVDTPLRLEALTAWGQQVIACTVDTVLGLIQNQRRPLFSFPAIACGAFVFDEIHSYDRRLFGELLTFLRIFPGAPALLMSASIPPNRLAALEQVLGDRLGGVIRGDHELEEIKRYRIEVRESAKSCWPDVLAALRKGKKVLWVCNTVGDALDRFRDALSLGIDPASIRVYHSRFLYKDRVERQKEVIAAFRPKAGPCLTIATQVCEMSLDISADLLVTALAPLPSLVQRLGRLNRYAEEDDPWPCLVYPFAGKPYDQKEQRQQMEDARKAISDLGGNPCDQAMLSAFLDAMKTQESWVESSTWLDGGWESEPLPAREGDTSITVVREEELPEIEKALGPESAGRWTSQRLVPWTIPILAKGLRWERRVGPYLLAPLGGVPYNKTEGAR